MEVRGQRHTKPFPCLKLSRAWRGRPREQRAVAMVNSGRTLRSEGGGVRMDAGWGLTRGGRKSSMSIKGSVPASPRGVSIDKMTGCYWSSAPDLRRVPPEGAFMGITTRANTNILAFPRKRNGNRVRVEDLRKMRARFYNQ